MFLSYSLKSQDLLKRLSGTISQDMLSAIIDETSTSLMAQKPMLVCGNGGSAADAMHIACELVGRFLKDRKGYPVIALSADSAILSAWGNDTGFEDVYARQVQAYGQEGGMFWGLSTSGNSENVVRAFKEAKNIGMTTLALTGEGGGKLKPLADFWLEVPSQDVPLIQQAHQTLYHYLLAAIEGKLAAR